MPRAKRGKRGVLLAAPELWLLPSQPLGARRTRSIVGDANLLSPQTRINLPLPAGPVSYTWVARWRSESTESRKVSLVVCHIVLSSPPGVRLFGCFMYHAERYDS